MRLSFSIFLLSVAQSRPSPLHASSKLLQGRNPKEHHVFAQFDETGAQNYNLSRKRTRHFTENEYICHALFLVRFASSQIHNLYI